MSSHIYNALGRFAAVSLNTCKEPARHAVVTHLCFPYAEA